MGKEKDTLRWLNSVLRRELDAKAVEMNSWVHSFESLWVKSGKYGKWEKLDMEQAGTSITLHEDPSIEDKMLNNSHHKFSKLP